MCLQHAKPPICKSYSQVLFLIIFLVPVLCFSQSPVQWSSQAVRIEEGHYIIYTKVHVQKHWYLYAQTDGEQGIESPSISWNNDNLRQMGAQNIETASAVVKDPIFSKNYQVYKDSLVFQNHIMARGTVPAKLKISFNAFAANGSEFLPVSETAIIKLAGGVENTAATKIILPGVNLQHPVAGCGQQSGESKGILSVFVLGLLGGLIALLTPCVFPMIPVTVSFFTNKSPNKNKSLTNGMLYGIFIFLIYTLASLPFHLVRHINPEIFNSISTNAGVNIFFFIVFIFFALSFFGLFEITLPSAITNKAASKEGLGSAIGIFFMALTLVIVSFSCTGPILGSLLVGSLSSDGAGQLTAGMAGFGFALGLPFALFAMFPHWLKKLPKSGGWMETVKKSLAFIELALAIKFLSNADLVQHWGILKREVFIGLWMVIFLCLSLYLLGFFKSKKQSVYVMRPVSSSYKRSGFINTRAVFGILFLLFAAYLAPGLTPLKAANLQLLSGFPPPLSYSIYGKANVHGKGLEPDVINDYDKALQLAKEQNKPLLIDFTGWACVNCRKMEEQVWTQPEIAQLIKQNFILVSLYVDDRQKLPASQQFMHKTSDGKEKDIITLGDKYATFQAENFKQVTQPLYVILNPSEQLLNHPVGYTPSVSQYKSWLQCGLNAHK